MVTLLFLVHHSLFLIIIVALAELNYWLFQRVRYIPGINHATVSSDLDGSRFVPGDSIYVHKPLWFKGHVTEEYQLVI